MEEGLNFWKNIGAIGISLVHGHTHSHSTAHLATVNVAFVVSISANLGFTIIEAAYAVMSNSVSLAGDAGHNLSDVSGLLLAWGAAYLVTKKSSRMYSYGYRKTTILAAIINALVLVFVSAFIAFESFERFITPAEVATMPIIIVAGIGIFVNGGTALLFKSQAEQDLNIRAAFLHLFYDAIISAGVVVTGVAILLTGAVWLDAVVGLLIVLVILYGTWGLLRDSVNLILDAVPQGIDRGEVEDYLKKIPGVTEIHDVHIWGMSTHENGLTAHLVMPENTLWDSEQGYGDIGHELEQRFNIHHVTLQVERDPDCSNDDCD